MDHLLQKRTQSSYYDTLSSHKLESRCKVTIRDDSRTQSQYGSKRHRKRTYQQSLCASYCAFGHGCDRDEKQARISFPQGYHFTEPIVFFGEHLCKFETRQKLQPASLKQRMNRWLHHLSPDSNAESMLWTSKILRNSLPESRLDSP